ncbi:MAG: glycosyltransferase [Candidatus Endonucleobacter bathymodioli]|uniref:Glycosyltransferase n=1 Tax=Candidatus Endonucleibacter bathymodioli TaxID=539814 RepID=A0AA90P1H0_9GAMM|nr:glycosyltransferase [Candidatus Endonucleobacter bathymodioli]
MNILHLTHTDINSDSRILKEMTSTLHFSKDTKVNGIGVRIKEEEHRCDNNGGIIIDTIELKTRYWKFLPTFLRHSFSLFELTSKMVYKGIISKPDIIHCNDIMVLPLGVILKFFTGSKLIYDAHELESNRNGCSKLSGKVALFVEKILWTFIDALIIVSPSIEKWYQKNVGEKYSEVILNVPVWVKDKPLVDNQYLRSKLNIPLDSKIFLYIGILGYGRGIDLITDVFKNNDLNSSLVFLGYGKFREKLKKLSEAYPNIYVHDAVPHDRVVSIAKSADIGLCLIQNVSLSDYYCLPNKLFEYAFSGIPVLASNFPDISNVVEKYKLGKCCNLDARSIYESIKEFENMEKLPVVDTETLFELSWKVQEEKLKKVYKMVIEGE